MMPKVNNSNSREDLGFIKEVLDAFRFLVEEYGFQVKKNMPTFVRFESTRVFINVYHGRSSYVLGLEIGQFIDSVDKKEVFYSIGDILDLLRKRQEEKYTFFQASTSDRVKKYVWELASLVQKYGKGFLNGDPSLFTNLLHESWKRAGAYEREEFLSRVRKDAENAWHGQDYTRLVEIYNIIREDLTSVELKKLEYAQKRLNK